VLKSAPSLRCACRKSGRRFKPVHSQREPILLLVEGPKCVRAQSNRCGYMPQVHRRPPSSSVCSALNSSARRKVSPQLGSSCFNLPAAKSSSNRLKTFPSWNGTAHPLLRNLFTARRSAFRASNRCHKVRQRPPGVADKLFGLQACFRPTRKENNGGVNHRFFPAFSNSANVKGSFRLKSFRARSAKSIFAEGSEAGVHVPITRPRSLTRHVSTR